MKPAWIPYMRRILWRYPQNHPKENKAIEKALRSGAPELVTLSFITKKMDYREAAHELGLADPDEVLEGFLAKIAKNLGLPGV